MGNPHRKGQDMANISAVESKATLSYKTVVGINPQDKSQKILRPVIVYKNTYDTAAVVHFALDNGYVTGGQFFANYGTVNGFLEACMALGKGGANILLNNWLWIHPVLKGTCDPETRMMGANNEIHVCAQAQKDLRRKASEFYWECVDDNSVRPSIQHLQAVGGKNDKEIYSTADIGTYGAHLNVNATTDLIKGRWDTTSEAGVVTHHEVTMVPKASSYSAIILEYPEELKSAPVGTVVTFTFLLKGGNPDASAVPATAMATVVSGS